MGTWRGFKVRRAFLWRLKAVSVFAAISTVLAVAGLSVTTTALATSPASFTSTNENVDGPGTCLNGNPTVNCNIYDAKDHVWMNGGSGKAALPDGTYFFAVLVPGGQADPNDGTDKNLSDGANGDYTTREFSVSNGVISNLGTHLLDSNKLRLSPYDDTTNNGGVYIMAICSAATIPVVPSSCKYDAFKVQAPNMPPVAPLDDLTVTKDAAGAYKTTYTWTIHKDADKTVVKQVGGSATFNYTIGVTPDSGTVSDVKVTGTIKVLNPNPLDDVTGVDVTDVLSDSTVCTVTGGTDATIPAGSSVNFPYTCNLSAVPQAELDNTATATWPTQVGTGTGGLLTGNSASFFFGSPQFPGGIGFTETKVDACVNVTDTYGGTLGTKCVSDASPRQFTYARSIPVVAGCVYYDNTATFTTVDLGATDSSKKTVEVCGPANTGALTIGFWKNTNGNSLISSYCAPASKQSLAAYLSGLGGGTGPFADAAGKNCSQLVTYVNNVIKGASATNMNAMLKAQMLATALDVYFTDGTKGYTATKVGSTKPPSNFLPNAPLGAFVMDVTAVCPMVDNTTAGTATCTASNPSTDANASGVVPSASMSVQAILDYESTTPSPFNGSTSNSVWYGTNRTSQEVAKNIFDQINNQLAFGI
jgi:hypothetical protein